NPNEWSPDRAQPRVVQIIARRNMPSKRTMKRRKARRAVWGRSGATARENYILSQANEIMIKLAWLKAHPGKTRRDYAAGLKDDSVWEWRRAQGRASIERERRAYLAAHPGRSAEDYDRVTTCAAEHFPELLAEFERWRESRERV